MTAHASTSALVDTRAGFSGPSQRPATGRPALPPGSLRGRPAPALGSIRGTRNAGVVGLLASFTILLGVVAGITSAGLSDDPVDRVPAPAPGPAPVPLP